MALIDDIANVILNSKPGIELPTAVNALNTDWFYFYNNATERTEKILKSALIGNQSINAEFLGTPITAGATTTNQEIVDHLNARGFVIGFNEIKILKILVFIANIVHIKQYFHKQNDADTYGTGNTVIAFSDLWEVESKFFDQNLEVVTTIALGDTGGLSIEDYINANNDPSWNLLGNIIYIFTATISATDLVYLYVGVQPQLIGDGNNVVTAADFFDLATTSYGMLWIEDCFVRKAFGNSNITIIEVNDEVHFKKIANTGDPLMLIGQTYDGGDKQLRTSYTQNNAVD